MCLCFEGLCNETLSRYLMGLKQARSGLKTQIWETLAFSWHGEPLD